MNIAAGFFSMLVIAMVAGAFAQAEQTEPPNLRAMAEMINEQGNKVGNALFIMTEKGLEVQVNLRGFESAANSEHAVHVHQIGKCQPTFDAAGDHFSPFGHNHGYLSPNGPHAGDLPNIWIEANGNAAYSYTTNLITLKEGRRAILDRDGAALVIHAQPDDYLTDSSGSAGDPIACGVIDTTAGTAQLD
jgi:Cu-Zn family superoxide dismutase